MPSPSPTPPAARPTGQGRDRAEPPPVPTPPEMALRVVLTRTQWVCLPILFAIPLLALGRTFGEGRGAAATAEGAIELRVSYPTRLRYKEYTPVDVVVRNRSARPIDTLRVVLDSAYVDRFSEINVQTQGDEAYGMEFTDVRPGESRRLGVEFRAHEYFRHQGSVRAVAGADSANVAIATFVYP